MKYFEFSEDVVSNVLKELEIAREFIKIAVFQIYSDKLFDLLENKLQQVSRLTSLHYLMIV